MTEGSIHTCGIRIEKKVIIFYSYITFLHISFGLTLLCVLEKNVPIIYLVDVIQIEPRHEISMCIQQRLRPACVYTQSDQSLC